MMPRVLVLTPSIGRKGGGVSESARLFVEAMIRDGRFTPEIIALHDADFEADRARWPDIPIRSFRAFGPRNYGFSPGMLIWVMMNRAQVVHVHGIWTFHVLCGALWSMVLRRPALVTPHGMLEPWILQRSARLKALVSWLYQRRFLRHAALHVLTGKERWDIAQAGLPTSHCKIIPNYAVCSTSPEGKPDWWKPEFEGRRIYLFLGRIHDKKGWRELCEAWAELNSATPAARDAAQLVFCGWPDGCPDFEPTIERLGGRFGNAIFAGPQFGTDRDRSLAAASVFVLPSKSEGLPMAVLEGWAAGVPSMMTRACNLDIGFETGAAIETGESAAAIAATLQDTQSWSDARLAQARDAANATVQTHFSQDAMATAYGDLLDGLIARR